VLVWLLDISAGGKTIYLSTAPVTYTDFNTGAEISYKGTLDSLSYTETMSLIGTSVSARELSIDCLPDVDMSQILSWGHNIAQGYGTLKIWDTEENSYQAVV